MAAPTTEDIEAYVKQASSQFGAGQEFFRDAAVRDIRAAPMPKLKPAFAKVLVSTDGSIWVLRYNVLPLANSVLDVFDVSGNWQGTVKMPAGFQPTQIMPGAVTGTRAAEDGVQHVLRYRMHRNY